MIRKLTACIWLAAFWISREAPAEDRGREQILAALRREKTPERALELAALGEAALPALQAALAEPATRAVTACAMARHPVPAMREAIEKLIPGGDQVAAYWAAKALGALGDPRSFPVLASRLAKKPRDYWELAFHGPLGYQPIFHRIRIGKDETIPAAPEIPNLRVAAAAMEALGALPGPEALAALRDALQSEQHLVRYGAVKGLGRRGELLPGEGEGRDLLRRAARSDPALYVRQAAGKALERLEARARQIPSLASVAAKPSLARLEQVPGIIFLKTRNRTETNLGFRDSYFFPKTPWYAWGENLFLLSPPAPGGALANLTRLESGGLAQGPEVSSDGKKVLAGMRLRAGEPFHIHEIDLETGAIRRLTSGAANDVDPCWLPDGRIVFSSDRDGTLEYYHQERTRALYLLDRDGGAPRQITFNPNQDYEPLLLRDGRILYSSYRFYGQDGSGGVFSERPGNIARIETQLRAVLPDGSQDSHFYGAQRGGFYVPVRELPDGDQFQAPSLLHGRDHLGVSVSQARELEDGRLVCVTPAGLTVVDPRLDPRDCEAPVFPEVVNLAGGEEVYIHDHDDLNPVGRYTSPYPVGGSLVLASHAPWHRLGGAAYGIYLLDLDSGEKTLVYDDPERSDVDPVPIIHRRQGSETALPLPPAQSKGPPLANAEEARAGIIAILSVFESDVSFDRSKVRYLRVLASERLAVSMNANGGFRTRVLATVPVEADGSAHLEVPADTPIHFNLLDGEENVLVHETEFTYVRPGERRTCAGCHERKTAAPLLRGPPPAALLKPPYRALPSRGDLIYMGQPWRTYSQIYR